MSDLFQLKSDPNSRTTFVIPKVKGEYMGKLTLRYFGPVVWETMLPEAYKDITDLEKIKNDIKDWIPVCKCTLCKTDIAGLNLYATGYSPVSQQDSQRIPCNSTNIHFNGSVV